MSRVKIQDVMHLLNLAYDATVKTGCRATVDFLEDYGVFVTGHRTKEHGEKLELCETFRIYPHEPRSDYGPTYKKCCEYFENLIKEANQSCPGVCM